MNNILYELNSAREKKVLPGREIEALIGSPRKQICEKKMVKPLEVLQADEIGILLEFLKSRTKGRNKAERYGHNLQISLALFSGLRIGEIAALKWRDVLRGFNLRDWFIPSSAKMGSQMPALMNCYSEELLMGLNPDGRSPWIFPGRWEGHISRIGIWESWHRIQLKLWGAHLYSFHALRHTAITLFYMRSRDVWQTKQFARHQSLVSTQIYIHLVENDSIKETMNCIILEFAKVGGIILPERRGIVLPERPERMVVNAR